MSYISGFMMGAAIGKGVRQFLGGAKQNPSAKTAAFTAKPYAPRLSLVSAQEGRRRYRAANVDDALAKLLEEKLIKIPYIKKIAVTAATGSILTEYDPACEEKIDELFRLLGERIFGVPAAAKKVRDDGEAYYETQAGSITRSIRKTVRDLSAWIKRNTGGLFDISSLASLLFLLRGLRKMMLTRQYPSGASMLWWAASLMRGWRTL